jgi:hypothetical protein
MRVQQHTHAGIGEPEPIARFGKVALAVRDFRENFPKDLLVTNEGIEVGICPPLREEEYGTAKGTVDDHRLYYYLRNGAYKLRQGVSKTHELWLGFDQKAPAGLSLAVAPVEWYASSKALGELAATRSTGVLAQYDAAFVKGFETYIANREENHLYGMLNFGDWWGERVINWGNSEYDTQHAFLMQFARTGNWRYYRAAEEIEWHNRDVDTVHANTDHKLIGGVYKHCVGHTGGYYEQSPVPGRGIIKGEMAADHTFIEGHLDYYFLTGDLRSFHTATDTADRYDKYFTSNYDFGNCREVGWHLILTMAMYNATYDPFYLNARRILVERVLERQTPNGGWDRQLTGDHCDCMPRHHMGEAGFMVAVLLTGLISYHQATGEEREGQSIVKGAHWLINDLWVPEQKAFRYTSCPKTFVHPWSNFLLFDGIVYAHKLTGDAKLREVLLEGTDSALELMNAQVDLDSENP